MNLPSPSAALPGHGSTDLDVAEARYGLRVAARLSAQSETLPHDIGARLRFAREKALERARAARMQPAVATRAVGGDTLAMGGSGWGLRLASLLPGVALVVGLVLIAHQRDTEQRLLAAEIDAALLADDLPPTAYADPGFAEYLRLPGS